MPTLSPKPTVSPKPTPALSVAPPRASLRRVRPDDLPELLVLCSEHAAYERQGFARRDQLDEWPRLLFANKPRLVCWVAEASSDRSSGETAEDPPRLLGFAACSTEVATWSAREFLHLDCLYLRPEARGLGLGSRLLRQVGAHAAEHGLEQIQWQTPVWNQRAAGFYLRHGATAQHKLRFSLPVEPDEAGPDRLSASGPRPDPGGRGERDSALGPARSAGGVDPAYRPRSIRSLGVESWDCWRVKGYAITVEAAPADPALLEVASRAARRALPCRAPSALASGTDPADPTEAARYDLGFYVLHTGTEANWLLVHWWRPGGILCRRLLSAPLTNPDPQARGFEPVADPDLMACVWELAVIDFERRAWMETVLAEAPRAETSLAPAGGPEAARAEASRTAAERYLAQRLSTDA